MPDDGDRVDKSKVIDKHSFPLHLTYCFYYLFFQMELRKCCVSRHWSDELAEHPLVISSEFSEFGTYFLESLTAMKTSRPRYYERVSSRTRPDYVAKIEFRDCSLWSLASLDVLADIAVVGHRVAIDTVLPSVLSSIVGPSPLPVVGEGKCAISEDMEARRRIVPLTSHVLFTTGTIRAWLICQTLEIFRKYRKETSIGDDPQFLLVEDIPPLVLRFLHAIGDGDLVSAVVKDWSTESSAIRNACASSGLFVDPTRLDEPTTTTMTTTVLGKRTPAPSSSSSSRSAKVLTPVSCVAAIFVALSNKLTSIKIKREAFDGLLYTLASNILSDSNTIETMVKCEKARRFIEASAKQCIHNTGEYRDLDITTRLMRDHLRGRCPTPEPNLDRGLQVGRALASVMESDRADPRIREKARYWSSSRSREMKEEEFMHALASNSHYDALATFVSAPIPLLGSGRPHTYRYIQVDSNADDIAKAVARMCDTFFYERRMHDRPLWRVLPYVSDRTHRPGSLVVAVDAVWTIYQVRSAIAWSSPSISASDPTVVVPPAASESATNKLQAWQRFSYVPLILRLFASPDAEVHAAGVHILREWCAMGPLLTPDDTIETKRSIAARVQGFMRAATSCPSGVPMKSIYMLLHPLLAMRDDDDLMLRPEYFTHINRTPTVFLPEFDRGKDTRWSHMQRIAETTFLRWRSSTKMAKDEAETVATYSEFKGSQAPKRSMPDHGSLHVHDETQVRHQKQNVTRILSPRPDTCTTIDCGCESGRYRGLSNLIHYLEQVRYETKDSIPWCEVKANDSIAVRDYERDQCIRLSSFPVGVYHSGRPREYIHLDTHFFAWRPMITENMQVGPRWLAFYHHFILLCDDSHFGGYNKNVEKRHNHATKRLRANAVALATDILARRPTTLVPVMERREEKKEEEEEETEDDRTKHYEPTYALPLTVTMTASISSSMLMPQSARAVKGGPSSSSLSSLPSSSKAASAVMSTTNSAHRDKDTSSGMIRNQYGSMNNRISSTMRASDSVTLAATTNSTHL